MSMKEVCFVFVLFDPILYVTVVLHRVEKDKQQYLMELNDLRAGVDHLTNEKVHNNSATVSCATITLLNTWSHIRFSCYID